MNNDDPIYTTSLNTIFLPGTIEHEHRSADAYLAATTTKSVSCSAHLNSFTTKVVKPSLFLFLLREPPQTICFLSSHAIKKTSPLPLQSPLIFCRSGNYY